MGQIKNIKLHIVTDIKVLQQKIKSRLDSFIKEHKMASADGTVGWDDVTYLRKKAPKSGESRSTKAVNSAMRSGGPVETSKKYGGGGNQQHRTSKDTAAVCRDTEETKIETVSLGLGKTIMKGRNDKGMTQKELATKINEKPQVINDYEAGRAIPNNQILSKIERIIGIKLRGKDKGQPFGGPKGKK